jgi:hypothetical protein
VILAIHSFLVGHGHSFSHWQSSGTVWDIDGSGVQDSHLFSLDVILQLFDRVCVTSHEGHKLEKQQNQRSTISSKLSMRLAASTFSKGLRMVA